MAVKSNLTAEFVRQIFDYKPETGAFRWKHRADALPHVNARMAGKLAGHKSGAGYVTIRINRTSYYAHRLAWLYVTGEWPSEQIDHINGDPSNNRFCNLRAATYSESQCNSRVQRNNILGIKGVCRFRDKYAAQICANSKKIKLGIFDTIEEAKSAYEQAARDLHGEFVRLE